MTTGRSRTTIVWFELAEYARLLAVESAAQRRRGARQRLTLTHLRLRDQQGDRFVRRHHLHPCRPRSRRDALHGPQRRNLQRDPALDEKRRRNRHRVGFVGAEGDTETEQVPPRRRERRVKRTFRLSVAVASVPAVAAFAVPGWSAAPGPGGLSSRLTPSLRRHLEIASASSVPPTTPTGASTRTEVEGPTWSATERAMSVVSPRRGSAVTTSPALAMTTNSGAISTTVVTPETPPPSTSARCSTDTFGDRTAAASRTRSTRVFGHHVGQTSTVASSSSGSTVRKTSRQIAGTATGASSRTAISSSMHSSAVATTFWAAVRGPRTVAGPTSTTQAFTRVRSTRSG